jgi:hypothetical protein
VVHASPTGSVADRAFTVVARGFVGACLEDLLQLSPGASWAWGPRTAPYRVEIIDAALGESLNATNALAGCWIPEDAETYALWLDVLRRRGIDVDT